VSKALAAGRAVLPLLHAARSVVAEWGRYAGTPRRDGHDDAWKMGAAIARLRDALAELSSPRHRIEMHPPDGPGPLAGRLIRAVGYARAGEATEITIGGQRVAMLIPAGRVAAAVTPGLALELATAVTGGRTLPVISRDKGGGYRVEPGTTAAAAGRTVVTDRAVLDAWLGGEQPDDESLAAFAAATMTGLCGETFTVRAEDGTVLECDSRHYLRPGQEA
jgi:antitoxin (DNA-binding transcriptional repressor) of toxin-antitoxin stability system